jgi:Putative prokaryotic signal transducing protein
MLVCVASAQGEPEAQMICARLSAAGIPAVFKRNSGSDLPQFGAGGAREVYVEDDLAARASELLSVSQFSDEELAELSDEAGRAADGRPSARADAP